MASDNLDWTAGEGIVLAADDIQGVMYPRDKVSLGADGSATDWDGTSTHGAWVNPRRLITFVEATVTAGNGAYAAGDAYGANWTAAAVTRDDAGSGMLRTVRLIDKDGQNAELDILWMRDNDSGYTPTDNAAYAPSDAQLLKCCGVTHVDSADWVDINGAQGVVSKEVEIPFTLESVDDLLFHVVIRGTPTYTDGLTIAVGIEEF